MTVPIRVKYIVKFNLTMYKINIINIYENSLA